MRLGPLGTWELLIILAVILLIFRPSRLPTMARSIGEMVREPRQACGAGRSRTLGLTASPRTRLV